MVNLQSEFVEFHDKIKLSYDENVELREKRDILLKKLRNNISADAASFSSFNQGSYAMHTKPRNPSRRPAAGTRAQRRSHRTRRTCPRPPALPRASRGTAEDPPTRMPSRALCRALPRKQPKCRPTNGRTPGNRRRWPAPRTR